MECSICGATFARAYEYKRHQKQQHSEPQFHCNSCNASFARKDALLRHERAIPSSCARWQSRGTAGANAEETDSIAPAAAGPGTIRIGSSTSSVSSSASGNKARRVSKATSATTSTLGTFRATRPPPRIPTDIQLVSDLFNISESRVWVILPVLHLPTLRRRLFRLLETNQTLEDYAACQLCPQTVQAVFWAAFTLMDRHEEANEWGLACREGLAEWATALELYGDPATTVKASPADMFQFVRAGVVALIPHYFSDMPEEASKLKQLLVTAHRLSQFGSEVEDQCSFNGDGLNNKPLMLARDPLDLNAWIDAEERARASCQLIVYAQGTAYLQGTPCPIHSGGYETARGFVPGAYYSSPLPCPDVLFQALPPAPETEEDVLDWYTSNPASRTAYVPLSFGDGVSWPDLPIGSLQRQRMVRLLFGGYFQNGFFRNSCVFTGSTLARLVAYRDFAKVRDWKLHDPPQGDSPDEVRARAMRDGLLLQITEFLGNVPQEVREADAAGNGSALRALGVQHWGPDFSFAICQNLVNWHGLAITLYSPRDFVATVASLSDEDLEWTKSAAFVMAFSHALISARIVSRALSLSVPLDAQPGADALIPEDEPQLRHPLWPVMVLRVALAHIYCLRRLQTISLDQSLGTWQPNLELLDMIGIGPQDLVSPELANMVLHDIKECMESIVKSQRGLMGNYSQMVLNVVGKLLTGMEVTREEAEAVRMLRKAIPSEA